jgi:hypothetical protein
MDNKSFPPQALSYTRKNKTWRKSIMDWADSKTLFNYSLCRKSVVHKKILYDLLLGKLHMKDLELIVNPEGIQAGFIPESIQHYPIINSKLNVLKGEESKRIFDYRVVITNPNAISEIENNKKAAILQSLQQWVSNQEQTDEESQQDLEKMNDFFSYEWQDMREVRANSLLGHYSKEYNFQLLFNEGFMDAMTVGEEIYQCDIIGGEPTLKRINPLKIRILKSGFSNRVEDADMIILEDYWQPGRIIDAYYDVLSKKDIDYIEKLPTNLGANTDSMDNLDERAGFINISMIDDTMVSQDNFFWDPMSNSEGMGNSLLPYDFVGNVRVLRVYWKSKRKIKKVKSYDIQTGEEVFNFYPENYIVNKDLGEEEEIYYVNEAWEGVKIGTDIYINMRPRVIQYNRLDNPSRCHFGIIGSIYNINDNKPFSLVDMMKPYSYLYDVIHDRLNKLIAKSWGNMVKFDLSKKPKGWDIDKWMYYAKTMGMVVEDSFNEGLSGAASGKLAGALNNASNGVVATTDGNMIQAYTNLLTFIEEEMAQVAGISKQREGQISNRETVGGVERATLQSSHITEWLFIVHEDLKKRTLEAFLETAKIALRGRSKKFQYILSDGSMKVMEIDGDEFAEADYGLVVDNSNASQELNQKLDSLAQAGLQTQTLSFSTVMKLYNSISIIEKQRIVERAEKEMQERQAQQQQQEQQLQQQQMQQNAQLEQAKMEQTDQLNARDNETKILVAQINGKAEAERFAMMNDDTYTAKDKATLDEQIRQFNENLKLEKEKLEITRKKNQTDADIKRQQLKNKSK